MVIAVYGDRSTALPAPVATSHNYEPSGKRDYYRHARMKFRLSVSRKYVRDAFLVWNEKKKAFIL